jgi:hypothetical protein
MTTILPFDSAGFVALLGNLMTHVRLCQNDESRGMVPQEGLMAAEILKELEPLSTLKGGPLQIELLEYVKGRPNVLVKLPAESGSNKWVTFAVCFLIRGVVAVTFFKPAARSGWDGPKPEPLLVRVDAPK